MAKNAYGERKLVGRFEKDKVECNLPTTAQTPSFDFNCGVDGYLLMDPHGQIGNKKKIHINKCFCVDCQKAFDVNKDIEADVYSNRYTDSLDQDRYSYYTKTQEIGEISCPECEKAMENISFVSALTNQTVSKNHINKNGAWMIPETITGRYLFMSEDENGKCTKFEDNTMTRSTIVYPSGKMFSYSTEMSRTYDFVKNSVQDTVTDIHGKTRTPRDIKDSIDIFTHNAVKKLSDDAGLNIRTFESEKAPQIGNTLYVPMLSDYALGNSNNIYKYTLDHEQPEKTLHYNFVRMEMNGSDNGDSTYLGHYVQDIAAKVIEKRFTDIEHPIMADSANNGMYLKEHHKDSDETNTPTDENLKAKYMLMMTKYPSAFEYAARRASERVTNFKFAQLRKAKDDPSYEAKEATPKAKAKMMREELLYVAEQLSTCDNKILKTIHDSKNCNDMIARLRSIAIGDTSELDENDKQRIDVAHASTESMQNTKKLKTAFKLNPIGVANTVYTCHKLGIKETNHVNKMIEIGENAPDINPPQTRIRGKYETGRRETKPNVNAGTIAPIQTRTAMRFMKNFANTHGPSDIIEIYEDPKKFELLNECLRMYDTITQRATILDGNAHDEESALLSHEMTKANLKNFLQQHSVTDAYVHYCEKFGKKTPQRINTLISEIKFDNKLSDVKKYAEEHGIDAAYEAYKDDMKGINDPKTYLTERFESKALADMFNNKQILRTQNERPLFNERSLQDIHDELSSMNQHLVNENISLVDAYPKEIIDMEKDYEMPDGSGTCKFRIHQTSFDVVRSATECHNCLGQSYIDKTMRGSSWTLYLENELGNRVAAIELAKTYGRSNDRQFEVLQFQGDHDNALPMRYKDIALQWLRECNIEHENNNNVKAFGTDASFYGDRNADYHRQEVDDVEGAVVDKDERIKRMERRIATAKRLYNWTPEGGYQFNVEIPEYTPAGSTKVREIAERSGSHHSPALTTSTQTTSDNTRNRGNEFDNNETPNDNYNNGDFGDT